MVTLILNVLCCLVILIQFSYTYAAPDSNHLPRDSKTGLLRYTPDVRKMSQEELDEFRYTIFYNSGSEKYCKVSGLPFGYSTTPWKIWNKPNLCREEIYGTAWKIVGYKDLCCAGHGTCTCENAKRHNHCRCGN